MNRYALKFESQRIDKLPPDIIVKGAWASTTISLVLTLPALGLFLGLYHLGVNVGISAGIGFSLHFALLALSGKISKAIYSFFED